MWGWNRHAIALLYGYFILLLSNFNRYILLFWIFIFIFRNLIKIRKLFWITKLCLREMEGFHKKNIFLLSQNKLFFKLYCFIKLRFKLKSWNEIRLIWKLYHPEVTYAILDFKEYPGKVRILSKYRSTSENWN